MVRTGEQRDKEEGLGWRTRRESGGEFNVWGPSPLRPVPVALVYFWAPTCSPSCAGTCLSLN